jgi:hypothetical protein
MKSLFSFIFMFAPIFIFAADKPIEAVLIDPVFDRYYACAEHQLGQFKGLGDALGTDCFIVRAEDKKGRKWLRPHRLEGHSNEDWFGWKQSVLSPIDGTIKEININKKINQPGIIGEGAASYLIIRRDDGLQIMLAHAMEIKVSKGDKVKKGQPIALVGNNGQSWHPHIHVGAWRDDSPLQIRFNQEKIKNQ